MEVVTEVFGKIEVADNQQIFFAEGLCAAEDIYDYILLPVSEDEILYCLQARDYPEVSFFLIDPFVVAKNFRLRLDADDLQSVGCESDVLPNEVLVLCPFMKGNAAGNFGVNFKSPILINRAIHRGKQFKNHADVSVK